MLEPVRKRSLSEAVFDQLQNEIVRGEIAPGAVLPAERELCDALQVNRGAVREALKRLEQAGLVSVRQGGGSRVLDFRTSAGLDLLPALVVSDTGRIEIGAARSVIELRSALAPDIARRAADRRGAACKRRLAKTVARMRETATDPAALGDLALEFWSELIQASDNIAYRLAFNCLDRAYAPGRKVFSAVFAEEFSDLASYAAIAEAVGRRDGDAAEACARALVRRGEVAVTNALEMLETARAEGFPAA